MYAVLTCLRDEHDLRLVFLAAAICVFSALASFDGYHRAASARRHPAWLAAPGLVAGMGVWATHFLAILAYQPSLEIGYRLDLTLASMLVSVAGLTGAFAIAGGRGDLRRDLAAGAVAGAAISIMHFMGVAAVRMPATIAWDPVLAAAALIMVVVLAALAFLCDRPHGSRRAAGAGLMILAICSLHFTAMGAIVLTPDATAALPDHLIGRDVLAAATAAATVLIIAAALVIQIIERMVKKATLDALSGALDTAPSALAFFDDQRRLTFWNAPFAQILSLYGVVLRPQMTLAELCRALARAPHIQRLLQGSPLSLETLREAAARENVVVPDERVFRLDMGDTPDGGFVIIMHDVTAQSRSAHALAMALHEAESASRAKSEFLANMSHEVRTPLNGVLGMAQVMGRHDLAPDQRERLSVIQESGATLLALLDNVLDIAKIEQGELGLECLDFDLSARLRATCTVFGEEAAAKGLGFRLDISPALEGPWRGDGARVAQVTASLVSNAVKFTEAGEVAITARACDEGVEIQVRDTGPGLDDAQLAHIFEAFSQADGSSTRRHGGAGLGLTLARQICDLMGGTLSAASAPGQGATFTLRLPLARGTAPAPAQAPEADRPMRILAAEDNAINQQVLAALMEPLGVELVIVEDGLAAVEAFERETFDLILMDIQMPRMSGVEAAAAIRDIETRRGQRRTPIVAVTANVMTHQIQEYLAVGMDAAVPKPIQAQTLIEAIVTAADPQSANAA